MRNTLRLTVADSDPAYSENCVRAHLYPEQQPI